MKEDHHSPRTILLLGASGFIGSNLAAELIRAGHNVLLSGRGKRAAGGSDSEFLQLPLIDTDAIVRVIRERAVKTVVHLASTMGPSSTFADFAVEQAEIALPTMRLGARLAELGVELVFLSSGGTVYGDVPWGLASESDPCAPISYYGQAKLRMEADLAFLRRTLGLQYLIIRPSNPYGRNQALRGNQGLISVALGKVADKRPLEVWGDGSVIRDYIFVDDMVRAMRELIERNVRNDTINLGSGEGHSLLDVVDAVRAATGHPLELIFHPARKSDVPRLVLDTRKLETLGLHQVRSLGNGIRAYADHLGLAV